jgi:hypothetical protein
LALHEFEAWLFSAPDTCRGAFRQGLISPTGCSTVVQQAGAPELINHGADTHPKARLHSLVGDYKETSDGPTLLGKDRHCGGSKRLVRISMAG